MTKRLTLEQYEQIEVLREQGVPGYTLARQIKADYQQVKHYLRTFPPQQVPSSAEWVSFDLLTKDFPSNMRRNAVNAGNSIQSYRTVTFQHALYVHREDIDAFRSYWRSIPDGMQALSVVARAQGVSEANARYWINQGQISVQSIRGRYYVSPEQFAQEVAALTRPPQGISLIEAAQRLGLSRQILSQYYHAGHIRVLTEHPLLVDFDCLCEDLFLLSRPKIRNAARRFLSEEQQQGIRLSQEKKRQRSLLLKAQFLPLPLSWGDLEQEIKRNRIRGDRQKGKLVVSYQRFRIDFYRVFGSRYRGIYDAQTVALRLGIDEELLYRYARAGFIHSLSEDQFDIEQVCQELMRTGLAERVIWTLDPALYTESWPLQKRDDHILSQWNKNLRSQPLELPPPGEKRPEKPKVLRPSKQRAEQTRTSLWKAVRSKQ